ncbi:uncharacterized protein BBA_03468 [Beauveria bassiana ARSEF 2860]|uniref:Uncharacterized protein n=1 Tax=Beauveria bassiana (strain ARSEF 2860) TaxID=655819 RepID=J5JRX2_BEAB2|nr:uncharacterized protein BBA_03468 [Beauveria bassiana ARSEF 2860]EJP67688.1 hypothetical protein BBA_03468 [Beauveria bassiana ARSEF 2860]
MNHVFVEHKAETSVTAKSFSDPLIPNRHQRLETATRRVYLALVQSGFPPHAEGSMDIELDMDRVLELYPEIYMDWARDQIAICNTMIPLYAAEDAFDRVLREADHAIRVIANCNGLFDDLAPEFHGYRVVCLTNLGRQDEALVAADKYKGLIEERRQRRATRQ